VFAMSCAESIETCVASAAAIHRRPAGLERVSLPHGCSALDADWCPSLCLRSLTTEHAGQGDDARSRGHGGRQQLDGVGLAGEDAGRRTGRDVVGDQLLPGNHAQAD
jgi:hypothetical protein